MARIKYYNTKTGKWEYADLSFVVGGNGTSSGGNMGDLEQLNMLIETDMLPAVHDINGAILTDENGKIILRC